LLHADLKHYFLIKLPQRAGALKEFLNEILGLKYYITHFEYTNKNFRKTGSAVVEIKFAYKNQHPRLIQNKKE
tara:strand:- start:193 stop:411 length:219 start_codon:yes stop_codon:yes gene_type:complete